MTPFGARSKGRVTGTPRHAPLRGTRRGVAHFAPFGDALAYGQLPHRQRLRHGQPPHHQRRARAASVLATSSTKRVARVLVRTSPETVARPAGRRPGRPQRGRSELTSRRVPRRGAWREVSVHPPLLLSPEGGQHYVRRYSFHSIPALLSRCLYSSSKVCLR